MGKNKHCTPELRRIILNMKEDGKTITVISKELRCSRKMIYNALKHMEEYESYNNKIRKERPRKTTAREDREIIKMSKNNPFFNSNDIRKKMREDLNVEISSSSIRRRLIQNNLKGRIARQKPLISNRNLKRRINFSKEHVNKPLSFWKKILWSDESKFNRLGNDGKIHVRRPPGKAFDPKYTVKTVKFQGGGIMVWGCMSWLGVGPLVKIDGIMDQHKYKQILQDVMEPYADEFLPITWKFMQDNDPKHTSRLVKSWLEEQKIDILDWPAQSPDLNPIENLWKTLGDKIRDERPPNLNVLWETLKREWYNITPVNCQNLIKSMRSRLTAVTKQKGYPTKY